MKQKIKDEWKGYCIEFLQKMVKDSNTQGFVVGLSGGIDSALAVCLAVDAVGKDNVLGVMMPCESSADSLSDAQALARKLEIDFYVTDLFNSFNKFIETINEPMFHTHTDNIQRAADNKSLGNIKARLRMTTLYSYAEKHSYLVLGTSNMSELKMGYMTKYGDGGSDCEPLGELFKSEVYEIAEMYPAIPESIINKTPSADLWAGQSDEEEMGFTYDAIEIKLRMADNCIIEPIDSDCVANVTVSDLLKIDVIQKKNEHKTEPVRKGPAPGDRYSWQSDEF